MRVTSRRWPSAREGILKKCAYPAFVLHFGIIILSLPTLIPSGNFAAYLRQTLGILVLVYGIALIVALLIPLLRDAGATSAALDSLLRLLPLFGKIRRAFAIARFCATYGMQFNAGINVIDALQAAQRASRSGLIACSGASGPYPKSGMVRKWVHCWPRAALFRSR